MRYDMDNTAMQDIYPDVFLDGVVTVDLVPMGTELAKLST